MSGTNPAPAAAVPTPLRVSRWAAAVGALLLVVGTALFFTSRDRLAEEVLANTDQPGFTAQQAQSATTSFLWTLLVVSVILGGLLFWCVWRTRGGRRGFRTAATVVLLFTVVFILVTGSYPEFVAGVILVVAVVLQYVPTSKRFFREGPRR